MKKYITMAILLGIFVVLGAVTLALEPTWDVKPGETPENLAADIMLWITTGYVILLILLFLVLKVRDFIKHVILHKRKDEDLDEFAIKARSYRSKFDE